MVFKMESENGDFIVWKRRSKTYKYKNLAQGFSF